MKLKLLSPSDLTEKEYHGESYNDHLSGSELWAYYNNCPAEYHYGERKESKSMITGSAVHSEVLEMHSFDELYYRGFEPTDETFTSDVQIKSKLKDLGITGYSTKSGNELYNMLLKAVPNVIIKRLEESKLEELNKEKIMIPFDQYDMAKDMRKQLLEYPEYAKYIHDGACEHSIVGECNILGHDILVKIRPDIILENEIINYKTTSNTKPSELIRSSYNYGYFMKEVFNALVYEQFAGVFPKIKILAQSKNAPYVCTGFTFTQEMIDVGMAQLEKALDLWLSCRDAGVVVDYAGGKWLENLDLEQWMFKV